MPTPLHEIDALRWDGARLHVIDQTLLPHEERWIELHGAEDTAAAILRLAVRGAPNIGIAAAYGLALAVAADPTRLEYDAALLRASRPTAVNLGWAVDRVLAACGSVDDVRERPAAARAAAEEVQRLEDAAGLAIGTHGADLLESFGARRLLTHCNAGALACGGPGSALAVVMELHRRHGDEVHVLAAETRPLLQGARLTVWELAHHGVPHTLCPDGAVAGLVARGEVDAVVVGCDRVAANGDVANKVGTYAHALAAAAAGIPFVVAGPTSTIDPTLPDGSHIPIEERDADEVRYAGGTLITLPDTPVRNPAFDVTPAALVTALVTEEGVRR